MHRHVLKTLSRMLLPGLFAIGCGNERASLTAASGADACWTRAQFNAGPIGDAAGPYYHQVAVARSTDGVTLTGMKQVLEHASVPDAVKLPDGRVLVYYVNGARGGVWIASLDADTARVLGPVVVDGIAEPGGLVDPDVMRLQDGRIRMYYLSGFGAPNSGANRGICYAESDDGVNFTGRGLALSLFPDELLTDPTVVQLRDGTWRMGISLGRRTVLARSSDGRTFTRTGTFDGGGIPEYALTSDGRLRLYVCVNGIESFVSADGGQTWLREASVVPPGALGKRIACDPSFVEGAGLFVFKTG